MKCSFLFRNFFMSSVEYFPIPRCLQVVQYNLYKRKPVAVIACNKCKDIASSRNHQPPRTAILEAILLRGSLIQPNCSLMRIPEIFMKFYENFSSLASGAPLKSNPGGYEDFNFEQLCRYQRYSHRRSRLHTSQIYSNRC